MPRRSLACSPCAAASTRGCARGSSGSRRCSRRWAIPSGATGSSRSGARTARGRWRRCWRRSSRPAATASVSTPRPTSSRFANGSALAASAAEKAAIIRAGVAIVASQAPEAMAVLLRHAAAVGVPLLSAGRDLFVTVEHRDLDGQRIGCAGPGWSLSPLTLGMLGSFQPENALLAVAAARALGVGAAAIGQGLARARWPGRFQVLARDGGWLVLDGAHNPGGARALVSSLRDYFGAAPVTFVVGILRDKDAPAILAELAPLAHRPILTASSHPPAADPAALRAAVPPAVPRVELAASPVEALALAGRSPKSPVVCVAGSLSLIGDVWRHLAGSDDPCPI